MRIALIKSSSMGDVIHAFPAVSDIVAAQPGIEIDWLVEESFADLPALHPAVCQTVPVAVRRWRKAPFSAAVRGEIGALKQRLAMRRYDLALDLQGLVKSAWLAWLTGAPIAGANWSCAREPLASLAYRDRYSVSPELHAIERLRQLAARALHHVPQGLPMFGLRAPARQLTWCPPLPYVVLLHATSRQEKQWPNAHWVTLAAALVDRGVSVVIPWGSQAEHEQAMAIAAAAGGGARAAAASVTAASIVTAPRLTLAECAALLAGASAVVGVDTGLTHLAAALSRPTVALFAATPAWRYGPYWSACATSMGEAGVWPQPGAVLQTLARLADQPAWAAGI